MKARRSPLPALLILLLLAGLVAVLLRRPPAASPGERISPLEITPPPPTDDFVVTFLPTVGPDGELPPLPPTNTPLPTWTPRPTPTRRPGPTATSFPTWAAATDAAGTILYTAWEPSDREALSFNRIYQVGVDAQINPLAEPDRISLADWDAFYNVTASPDGRYLLFMRPSMPGGIPHVYDRQSLRLWSLAEEGRHESGRFFGWHPDSRQILFWNDQDLLLLINVETRERTTLSFLQGPVQGAAFSPDGQTIAYISYQVGSGEDRSLEALWSTSTAGSDAQALFKIGLGSYLFRWSPDGQYILYMGGPGIGTTPATPANPEQHGPLWIVDPDGQSPRPLFGRFIAGSGYEPEWAPDSKWVAFTGLDDDQEYGCTVAATIEWPHCQFVGTSVFIENIQTGEVRRLATGIKPVWSPDGSTVAFLSDQSGSIEIWTIRIDGTALRQLTSDGLPKNEIQWIAEREVRQ